MSDFCILEGISSVSAVINNMRSPSSNSPRYITEVYVDSDKLNKFDRSFYARYKFLNEYSQLCNYKLILVPSVEINVLLSGKTHGGIGAKCICPPITELDITSVKDNAFYCYLDGVDDPFNLGYIIRTLYPFDCAGVVLSQNNKLSFLPEMVIKSSAGATEAIDIFTSSPESFCEIMHLKGYKIACASIRNSLPCHKADLKAPIALVIGGEKRGISRKILDEADINIRIDYKIPHNGSLPAVAAASVLAYEVGKQN